MVALETAKANNNDPRVGRGLKHEREGKLWEEGYKKKSSAFGLLEVKNYQMTRQFIPKLILRYWYEKR